MSGVRPRDRRGSRRQEDSSRRYITLAILGGGMLIAFLVLLQSFAPQSGSSQTTAAGNGNIKAIEASIPNLQARVRQNPADTPGVIALGNAYYDTEKYAEAITWYEKALESVPANTDVRTDLGTAYFYSGNSEKAKEQWGKVLEQDPNKIQVHYNLGILYSRASPPDLDAAAKSWEKVISIAPNSEQAKSAEKQLQTLGRR